MKKKLDVPDDTLALYEAAINYIRNRGGSVTVIGGVQVQEWPGEGKLNFVLGVKVTGRKPPGADENGEAG